MERRPGEEERGRREREEEKESGIATCNTTKCRLLQYCYAE